MRFVADVTLPGGAFPARVASVEISRQTVGLKGSGMKRRRFIGVVAGGLLAAPLAAEAQQAGKGYRIGLLAGPVPPLRLTFAAELVGALHSAGYVEGRNAVIERGMARADQELTRVATTLARSGVDVIVAAGLSAVRAAKDATKTIPIVMLTEGDPVVAGIVSSLGRPGGNVTGLTLRDPELTGKRLELLKDAVPGLLRVGVLWSPGSVEYWQAAQQASQPLGVELRSLEIGGPHDIESLFEIAVRDRCGAVIVPTDYLTNLHSFRILALARAKRMPAMYTSGAWWVRAQGGLMAYGADEFDAIRRVAFYVDKILRGTKPADLPVEQPTKFELVINLKTAKALGLTIPPSLLARADQLIE
jgi:putative ABC transport system substrate-binding protein